jgi:hypothetical protein
VPNDVEGVCEYPHHLKAQASVVGGVGATSPDNVYAEKRGKGMNSEPM